MLAALAAIAAGPACAQTEFTSACLCQRGNDPAQFSAEMTLTDANRAAMRKLMEAGDYSFGRIVKATSKGCQPAEWRKGRQCGTVKVTTFNRDGSPNVKEYDNTVVVGSKLIRVQFVSGLPIKTHGANGTVTLDDEKWAKARVLLVIGTEQR
ncbi:MAG TPA: hypothetical protein VGM96_11865 [Reyranella sp.]|jgi:hypothetical protein